MTVADSGAPAADVVEAEAGDLAALVDLHALCFGEAWSRDAIAGVLGAPGAFGLIACSGGRAAGFVLVRAVSDQCELLAAGVLPVMRRRGIGRILLDAALARAAAEGARVMFLEVAEDNPAARALYAGAGFAGVGRWPDYYRRPGAAAVAAVVLRRAL